MGAGAVGAMMVSAFINGILIARDAIHGPIAGAIACGASALYITNPVYAFVAGASGGICQAIIQNVIEKTAAKKKIIISTVSWSLFGIQGLIGAGFAAGWKAIAFTVSNSMPIESAILNQTSQF
jgi:ammonia channel protein AmtB